MCADDTADSSSARAGDAAKKKLDEMGRALAAMLGLQYQKPGDYAAHTRPHTHTHIRTRSLTGN